MAKAKNSGERLEACMNELLYAKHYIQLISATPYKARDGEVLRSPHYKAKDGAKGNVVRAVFFATTNGETKLNTVLYRAFGVDCQLPRRPS